MLKLYEENNPEYQNCIILSDDNHNDKNSMDDICNKIKSMFNEVIKSDIDVLDDYQDYIDDSIYISKIHLLIDNRYPGIISLAQMFKFSTIEDIAKEIYNRVAQMEA